MFKKMVVAKQHKTTATPSASSTEVAEQGKSNYAASDDKSLDDKSANWGDDWQAQKAAGSKLYAAKDFLGAKCEYSGALDILQRIGPSSYEKSLHGVKGEQKKESKKDSGDNKEEISTPEYHVGVGQLWLNISMCQFQMGEYDECVQSCDLSLRYLPGYPKTVYRQSLAREKLGNYRAALNDALTFAKAGGDKKLASELIDRLRKREHEESKALITIGSDGKPTTDLSKTNAGLSLAELEKDILKSKNFEDIFKTENVYRMRILWGAVVGGRQSKKSILALNAIENVSAMLKKILKWETGEEIFEDIETGEKGRIPASDLVQFLRKRYITKSADIKKEECSITEKGKTVVASAEKGGESNEKVVEKKVKNSDLLSEQEWKNLIGIVSNGFKFLYLMGLYVPSQDEASSLKDHDKDTPLPSDTETDTAQELIRKHLPLVELKTMLFRVGKIMELNVEIVENPKETLLPPVEKKELEKKTLKIDLTQLLEAEDVVSNAVRLLYYYSPNYSPKGKGGGGIIGKMENHELLMTLSAAVETLQNYDNIEGVRVATQIFDERRRLGQAGKAYVPSQAFYHLIESLLKTTPVCDPLLSSCLAQAWFLLADSERPKEDDIDLQAVAQKMILPFLGEGHYAGDHSIMANGFLSLATMFYVNIKAATSCVQAFPSILQTILNVCYTDGTASTQVQSTETRQLQIWASDVLTQAIRDLQIRTEVIKAGGVDLVMKIFKDLAVWDSVGAKSNKDQIKVPVVQQEQNRLLRAKIVCILALLAAHHEDVCTQVFELVDIMAALQTTFIYIKDLSKMLVQKKKHVEKEMKTGKKETFAAMNTTIMEDSGMSSSIQTSGSANPFSHVPDERVLNLSNLDMVEREFVRSLEFDTVLRIKKSFLEAFVYLSIHKDFKTEFITNEDLMKGFFVDLITHDDIVADANVSFFYATVVFNFFRSSEDRVRPRKKEYPYTELGDEEISALDEFYARMPDESKPAKNGEVDAGSPQLAMRYRTFIASHEDCISKLNECCRYANSLQGKIALAFIYNFLTKSADSPLLAEKMETFKDKYAWRRIIMKTGGINSLLKLHDSLIKLNAEKVNSKALDAVRQAVAHVAIVTDPKLYSYSDGADMILPLSDTMKTSTHELYQFESALALTNLISNPKYCEQFLQLDGWNSAVDLLFSSNEMCQRAGLELMNNMCGDGSIVEKLAGKCQKYADGKMNPESAGILTEGLLQKELDDADIDEKDKKDNKGNHGEMDEETGIKHDPKIDTVPAEIKIMLSFCAVVTREESSNDEDSSPSDSKDEKKLDDSKDKKKNENPLTAAKQKMKEKSLDRLQYEANDIALMVAATGCLAQLTESDIICRQISLANQFHYLLGLLLYPDVNPNVEMRAVTAVCNMIASEQMLGQITDLAYHALHKKTELGFKHEQSQSIYENFKNYMIELEQQKDLENQLTQARSDKAKEIEEARKAMSGVTIEDVTDK